MKRPPHNLAGSPGLLKTQTISPYLEQFKTCPNKVTIRGLFDDFEERPEIVNREGFSRCYEKVKNLMKRRKNEWKVVPFGYPKKEKNQGIKKQKNCDGLVSLHRSRKVTIACYAFDPLKKKNKTKKLWWVSKPPPIKKSGYWLLCLWP